MKKQLPKLDLISTRKMSYQEWLLKRNEGIGGSDVSAMMGLNPYFSNLELFYQKIGLTPSGGDQNEAMFWGTHLESIIRNKAQYLDLDTGEYIDNYASGNKLRHITEKKLMIRNYDIPHLLANVDGFENVRRRKVYFSAERIAEIKTISKQSEDKWEGGLPAYYIAQAHHYMIVCEPLLRTQETCFYVLRDGRTFWGVIIKELDWFRDAVIEETTQFWESVVKAKEILANEKNEALAHKAIEELEPEPNPTLSAERFISDLQKLKTDLRKIEGDEKTWALAVAEKEAKTSKQKYEEEQREASIKLRNYMRKNDVDVIDFGESGKVTFRHRLYCNIKLDEAETVN